MMQRMKTHIQSGFQNERTARWLQAAFWAVLSGVLVISVLAGLTGLSQA